MFHSVLYYYDDVAYEYMEACVIDALRWRQRGFAQRSAQGGDTQANPSLNYHLQCYVAELYQIIGNNCDLLVKYIHTWQGTSLLEVRPIAAGARRCGCFMGGGEAGARTSVNIVIAIIIYLQ